MNPKPDRRSGSTADSSLRQRAEKALRARAPAAPVPLTSAAAHRQLHELRVHQIELEMQNEELRRAQQELESSRARYFDLYDLAPVGYLTLSERNLILEANLTAAALLHTTVRALVSRPLTRFILPEDQDIFYHHCRQLFATGQPQSCELRLRRPDAFCWARLDGAIAPGEAGGAPVHRVTLADITARKEAEASLRHSEQQLRALALRLDDIREQERAAIAREIHDVLAQDLTRLKIDLVWIAERLSRPLDAPARDKLAARAADATAQADLAITTVQRIATELRPVILDALGLAAAVEWQVEDFARRTGLACTADVPPRELPLPRNPATALFRILQESLTNIARHAGARHVAVHLAEESGAVMLSVHDDGSGITRAKLNDPQSLGLVGMRERAQALGGALEISSAPGAGTTVVTRVPSVVSLPRQA